MLFSYLKHEESDPQITFLPNATRAIPRLKKKRDHYGKKIGFWIEV